MNKYFKFLKTYWLIFSFILSTVVAGFRLKGQIDNHNNQLIDLQKQMNSLSKTSKDNTDAIDKLDHRVLPLEKVEDLRERGLMK